MLSKKYRVKKFKEFNELFDKGDFKSASSFYIKYTKNEENYTKISVVVPKKVAKLAVTRNRIKRQLSEIIRLKYKELKPGYNIILICKPGVLEMQYGQLDREWDYLMEKSGLREGNSAQETESIKT